MLKRHGRHVVAHGIVEIKLGGYLSRFIGLSQKCIEMLLQVGGLGTLCQFGGMVTGVSIGKWRLLTL